MSRRALTMLGAVAGSCCLLVATACTGEPGASPTPSPSSSAPTAVETPPETEQEREQRVAFEAAEKSYRAFIKENDRLGNAGGALRPSKRMTEVAAGPYLEFYAKELRYQKQNAIRYTGDTRIGSLDPGAYSPEELILEVCEDGSNTKVIDADGKQVSEGQILKRSLYLRPIDGRWKLWNGDERGAADSCS